MCFYFSKELFMRMTRNIALTLTAACIATASLAQSRVQPRAIAANQCNFVFLINKKTNIIKER